MLLHLWPKILLLTPGKSEAPSRLESRVKLGQDRSYGEKESSESIIKYLGVFVGDPLFFQIFTLCYLIQLCLV